MGLVCFRTELTWSGPFSAVSSFHDCCCSLLFGQLHSQQSLMGKVLFSVWLSCTKLQLQYYWHIGWVAARDLTEEYCASWKYALVRFYALILNNPWPFLWQPDSLYAFTGYTLAEIVPCLIRLHQLHLAAKSRPQKAIYEKYRSTKWVKIVPKQLKL